VKTDEERLRERRMRRVVFTLLWLLVTVLGVNAVIATYALYQLVF
jgi:hypothetical protein